MDNLSHLLVGLAAAELIQRSLPTEPEQSAQNGRRRLLLWSGVLSSGLPDLDIVLAPLLPAPLGYLLHHRGHTHTFFYAIPQALFLAGLIWVLWPEARKLLRRSYHAVLGLVLTLTAGFGLHFAMDYLNSYGIHPFHPFDSRWLYGDLVFIIEPVFWVAFGVPLAMLIQRAWLRFLLIGLLAIMLAAFTAGGYLHWLSLLALYALGAFLMGVQWSARRRDHAIDGGRAALLAGAGALAVFVAGQAAASHQAAQQLGHALAAMDARSVLLDSARTAFPANPLCWSFVSIENDEAAGHYRLRRGILSIAPGLLPVEVCPPGLAERPAQARIGPSLAFLSEYEGSLADLRTLHAENCHFNAWMRFARAPQIMDSLAFDLRYASTPRGNFTTLDLADFESQPCPRYVPRWEFPRTDLLGISQE
jgi:inner membrane protein